MTTIRTPPASPKPAPSTRFSGGRGGPVPATNPLARRVPAKPGPATQLQQKMDKIEDIKLNFLERLEVLPESAA